MSRMEIPSETYTRLWRKSFAHYCESMSAREARQRTHEIMRSAFIPVGEALQSELEKDLEDARLHISE